jgi:hypothetical protein
MQGTRRGCAASRRKEVQDLASAEGAALQPRSDALEAATPRLEPQRGDLAANRSW